MIRFTGPNGFHEPITQQKMYSDGTTMVKTLGWSRIVEKATTMVVQPSGMNEFVTAMFLMDALNYEYPEHHVSKLILPYIPGARQDRSNPTGDVLFTLHSVADMINARHFNSVVVLDPHSEVSVRKIGRLVEYPIEDVVKQIPDEYVGVIAPDEGAVERAMLVAEALEIPLFRGGKTRDVATGKLSGFTLETLINHVDMRRDRHYLVIDDICDGGGTFLGLAQQIRNQGASADLYVSHGIFSKGVEPLLDVYENVYTTDSFVGRHDGAKVIPVVSDMENF